MMHFIDNHQSVLDHMYEGIMEMLHCDLCLGQGTNNSCSFQHNAFNLIAPTAPKDDAPAEEYDQCLKKFCKSLELSKIAAEKAKQAGYRRRDVLLFADDKLEVIQEWKKEVQTRLMYDYRFKPRSDIKLTDELREQLRVELGREAHPSVVIIDAQSVKTTEKGGLEALMAENESKVERGK